MKQSGLTEVCSILSSSELWKQGVQYFKIIHIYHVQLLVIPSFVCSVISDMFWPRLSQHSEILCVQHNINVESAAIPSVVYKWFPSYDKAQAKKMSEITS
jgi:hypothetical protein